MAHFAEVVDERVVNVIVVANEDCGGGNFPDSELVGQEFLATLYPHENKIWKQTSYNHLFRKQYAAIGGSYDVEADVFVQPQPFPSWTLDSNHDWQPPVAKPDAAVRWDEESQSWIPLFESQQ